MSLDTHTHTHTHTFASSNMCLSLSVLLEVLTICLCGYSYLLMNPKKIKRKFISGESFLNLSQCTFTLTVRFLGIFGGAFCAFISN